MRIKQTHSQTEIYWFFCAFFRRPICLPAIISFAPLRLCLPQRINFTCYIFFPFSHVLRARQKVHGKMELKV